MSQVNGCSQWVKDLRSKSQNTILLIRESGNGSQSRIKLELAGVIVRKHGCSDEELSCSLGVTNVGIDLILTGVVQYVLDLGRNIVESHLLLIEVPELLILGCQVDVTLREFITSVVAKPHIISSFCKHEARGSGRVIDDPRVGRLLETVLEQDDRLSRIWDTEHT